MAGAATATAGADTDTAARESMADEGFIADAERLAAA
jgi:hypothetical protein